MVKAKRKYLQVILLLVGGSYLLVGIALPWLPAPKRAAMASAFGVGERLLPILAVVFTGIGFALVLAIVSLSFIQDLVQTLDSMTRIIGRLVNFLSRSKAIIDALVESAATTQEKPEKGLTQLVRLSSDLGTYSNELEASVASKVKESEERLRSEWRFVVALIAAIVLGVVPMLFAVLAIFRK